MPSPELTCRQGIGGGHTTSLHPSRPYSQMSNYSEDLHALSSVEVTTIVCTLYFYVHCIERDTSLQYTILLIILNGIL